jgi:hypothetical protein
MACDWVMEAEDFPNQSLFRFMDAATELNCDLFFDWWLETKKPVMRIVLQAPSHEILNQLSQQAGAFLGLNNWHEVTTEYFREITKDGQVPSMQKMLADDGHRFGRLMENWAAMIVLIKQQNKSLNS